MKKSWKKWCLLIVAILMLIGGPILINECYKTNNGYVTLWSAADMLAYYGAIVGALTTIIALVITISFTRKQIQRESYLRNQNDKWGKIDLIITDVLDKINPQRILTVGIDNALMNNDRCQPIILAIQKYQMDCKTATDQLIAYLSSNDYPRLKKLLTIIRETSDVSFEIAEKERIAYSKLGELQYKGQMQRTIELEQQHPNSFAPENIAMAMGVLDRTKDVCSDTAWEELGDLNQQMVDVYENRYRKLLELKGQTFTAIYAQISNNANDILCFRKDAVKGNHNITEHR